ncbi:hypothetical protein BGX27_010965 [Mortierella sp. AM989]|nr:hypothetical protein BGX27_010965 [Mortierella sp. AM989]
MVKSWHPSPEILARLREAQTAQNNSTSTSRSSSSTRLNWISPPTSLESSTRQDSSSSTREDSIRQTLQPPLLSRPPLSPFSSIRPHRSRLIRTTVSPQPSSNERTPSREALRMSYSQLIRMSPSSSANIRSSPSNPQSIPSLSAMRAMRRTIRDRRSATPQTPSPPTLRRRRVGSLTVSTRPSAGSSDSSTAPILSSTNSGRNTSNSAATNSRSTSSPYSNQNLRSRASSSRQSSERVTRAPNNRATRSTRSNTSESFSSSPSTRVFQPSPSVSAFTGSSIRNVATSTPTPRPVNTIDTPPYTEPEQYTAGSTSMFSTPTRPTTARGTRNSTAEPLSSRFRGVYLQTSSRRPSAASQQASKEDQSSKTAPSALSRKSAAEESYAFHNSAQARCDICMFETLPMEILCTILEYVIMPWSEEMAANDDGDGPRTGSSLRYWYLDPNRSLLRLVCHTWNITILAMAREINIELGADESMASLLESVAAEKKIATATTASATTTNTAHPGVYTLADLFLFNPGLTDLINNSSSRNTTPANRNSRTLRRSARLLEASSSSSTSPSAAASAASTPSRPRATASTSTGSARTRPDYVFPYVSTSATGSSRVSLNFNRYIEFAESHGIQSDRHPRLFQHIVQNQCEGRRVVKQTFIPIEKFYNPTNTSAVASNGGSSSSSKDTKQQAATTPWTCPPNISALSVKGKLPRYSDPQEDIVMSAIRSVVQPISAGDGFTTTTSNSPSSTSKQLTNEAGHGTKLENWLKAAVPNTVTSFSVASSSDFGINGLLALPKSLSTLDIIRCPKITGGALLIGFKHLSNLTRLAMCTDLLFTDESFIYALESLSHLRQLDYTYPSDPVQPAWKDLFRYCSSCELYHRRVNTKTYTRRLLMAQLPSQIQQFSFAMDEPKFHRQRIDGYDQNSQHSFDRADNTRLWLCLWKAGADTQNIDVDGCSSNSSEINSPHGGMSRSWWPENLVRLDLSRCAVLDSKFDVPSRLKELVIAYPLEPNQIKEDEGSEPMLEEDKQWFPESLTNLEVQGVPYHASCEIQDNPPGKVASWMSYTNKILKQVPRHLERFTINSFQVPETEALTALQKRAGKTLKTWTVRLLCPQQPKSSGHTALQLYAPIIYVDDDEEEEDEGEENWWSWLRGSDEDSDDSDMEPSSNLASTPSRRQRSRSNSNGNGNGSGDHTPGQEEMRQVAESELYEVTPVMLRSAAKGMVVLEKLEVHVNFQHYRFCRSLWKGRLGLSEPTDAEDTTNARNVIDLTGSKHGSPSSSSRKKNTHPRDSWDILNTTARQLKRQRLRDELFEEYGIVAGSPPPSAARPPSILSTLPSSHSSLSSPPLSLSWATTDIKNKGKSVNRENIYPRDPSLDYPGPGFPMTERLMESWRQKSRGNYETDVKGKGKKVELSSLESEEEMATSLSNADSTVEGNDSHGHGHCMSKDDGNNSKILGHRKLAGCPTTEIVYWNNSCCGKRCLGWIRHQLN